MTETSPKPQCCLALPWLGYLLFFIVLVGTVLLGIMIISVTERRAESVKRTMLYEIPPYEMDASVWGRNFPRQYDSWKRTEDMSFKSKYGGSKPKDYLEVTPEYVVLFGGFPFSLEYNQGRGHSYALEDVLSSLRIGDATGAACWECKSPDVPRLMNELGLEEFTAKKLHEIKHEINNPISCFDCHDENTLALRSLRPAVLAGFQSLGKTMESLSHQEKRSAVCSQCHSTYHFSETGRVTFPWTKGLQAENVEEYYRQTQASDWIHPISNVRMIKTRHPDYEIFTTSLHYARGVSCADCHMPYTTEGAEKFSNHHLRSPLANISGTCAVCHRWGEEDTVKQVELIQDRVKEVRDRAMDMLVKAHFDIAACMEIGADDGELSTVRDELRYAQMYWDFIASANAMGFHSPQESQRILTTALEKAAHIRLECTRILAKYGYTEPVLYPDYRTKEQAGTIVKAFLSGDRPSLLQKNDTANPVSFEPEI